MAYPLPQRASRVCAVSIGYPDSEMVLEVRGPFHRLPRYGAWLRSGLLLFSACVLSHVATAQLPFTDGFESGSNSSWSATRDAPWQPAPGTSWQWQLSGTIDTSVDVAMYDVDLFETPQATIDTLHAAGRIVICYFSAGSWESYRPDANDFPASVLGNPLSPPFQDELWLDVCSTAVRTLMLARLDLAQAKSCDGVEPDNVDGYTNASGFPIGAADQLTYNRFVAYQAHLRGLSAGLKNDLDQVLDLLADFDWALDEQCFEYGECSLLTPFVDAGKAVFGVEYTGDPASFCPQANAMGFSWLKKNIDLDAYRVDCLTWH